MQSVKCTLLSLPVAFFSVSISKHTHFISMRTAQCQKGQCDIQCSKHNWVVAVLKRVY